MPTETAPILIAVDIGNSRIKLGRFDGSLAGVPATALPEPTITFDVPITDRSGHFDAERLLLWAAEHAPPESTWLIASVHRGACETLIQKVTQFREQAGSRNPLRRVTHLDGPLPIDVSEPHRVGIDRLLAALAADRIRRRDRAAIVIDLGSAMTVDRIEPDGTFAGGAILPGIAMSARALAEQTDALPQVGADRLDEPPESLGKSTVTAIEAGLYWGAVGAIRELVARNSDSDALPPDLFLTGGASAHVAGLLTSGEPGSGSRANVVRHVPHLVLAGIALVHAAASPP
jgi:type III pantothenate kinase